MPITDHPKVDYDTLYQDVLMFSGLADLEGDSSGATILSTAPYKPQQIKRRIGLIDIELVTLIATTPDHPFREEYITETPSELTSGSLIPAYMGVHSGVEIGSAGGSDFTFSTRVAQSLEHLIRWQGRSITEPKESLLYFIHNSRIYLRDTAKRAKVYVPTIPIPDESASSPSLGLPKAYHNGLLAGVLATMRMPGADAYHRDSWTSLWVAARSMIEGRALSIPEPERLARVSS